MTAAVATRPSVPVAAGSRLRAPELQDPLNRYLYHPLAARLARVLVPTGVSPNAVSVAGALLVWAAAWAYAVVAWPVGALLGFGLHMLWHVFDGADGDLARLTGKASPTGELVDGLCDYAANILLYFVLAAILDDSIGGWAWVLAVAAGVSHAFQTNHAETQRRAYLWWAYGVPWLKHAHDAGHEVFRERSWFSSTFAGLARLYLKAASWMAPGSGRLDGLVDRAAGDSRRLTRIRRLVRRSSRRSLVYEKLVGPNPRTIMLGASMLAGSPLWYFLGEAVLLNLILAASIVHHNAVRRWLVERLA
jgi:phosphatidylglycerophosphate synthase